MNYNDNEVATISVGGSHSAMPVQTRWLLPDQVILNTLEGMVVPHEMQERVPELTNILDQSQSKKVHIIMDVSRLDRMVNMSAIIQVMPRKPHPKFGWILIVGEAGSPLKAFWGNLFMRLLPIKVRRFDRLENAITFLKENDPSIEWEQADSTKRGTDLPM